MADTYIKYKVVNADSLCYREKPSLKSKVVGYLHRGDKITVVKGWSKKADGVNWYKLKLNDNYYYVSAKYLLRVTPNYLSLVAKNADKVYGEIVKLGCKHKYGAKDFDELKHKKITTCATAVSIVLQLSGMMDEGKLINHTDSVSDPLKKKRTIPQTMTGRQNIHNGTYSISRVGKTFHSLPAKYKRKGVIYVYDSNMAICAGNNEIYSCNNSASQMKNGRYIKDKLSSGYCFTEPIIYVILPND